MAAIRFSAPCFGIVLAVMVPGGGLPARLAEPAVAVLAEAPARPAASDLWLAPAPGSDEPSDLATAAALIADGRPEDALPLLANAPADPALAGYARLYQGRAYLALEKYGQAAARAREIIESSPAGYLGEAALWLLADASEAAERWDDATLALQALSGMEGADRATAYLRLGRAAEQRHDATRARGAFAAVYFEFPLSAAADEAHTALARYGTPSGPDIARLELGRAQKLYAAGRYADARQAFEDVRRHTPSAGRSVIDLRIAQCDVGLRKYSTAVRLLEAVLAHAGGSQPEAELAYLDALRGLGHEAQYVARVAAFVKAHAASPLAETALDDLGTYYIIQDEDSKAAAVFADMYATYPHGAHAARAAWKAGWWAYRHGNYPETIRLFESAFSAFGRSDYRPSWLYWSAKAHQALGDRDAALAGYRQTIADYRNSYYGREALRAATALAGARGAVVLASARRPATLTLAPGPPPANAPLDQAPARRRPVRRRRRRTAAGPNRIGTVSAHRRDHRVRAQPPRAICAAHHGHAPRVSAVHGGGRRGAPSQHSRDHLPARALGPAAPLRGESTPRPVPARGARRPGVDVPGRHPVVGQRLGPDAALARDGAPVRERSSASATSPRAG